VRSRLQSDPQFANATQNGDEVSLDFNLPLEIRLAAQARPLADLSVEVGVDYEAWQMQKELQIVPHGITIEGVPGIGKYDLRPMAVTRDLHGTFSVHAGGEWALLAGKLIARAGYLLETSATPDRTASVLAPDAFHQMVTLGAGVPLGRLRLDVGYGHMFTSDRTVTDSAALQLNPIQPSMAVAVGNGKYSIATDIFSAGVAGRF
jgi:long-subunit fatty acid transport protein